MKKWPNGSVFAEMLVDEAVSSTIPFIQRPEGGRLFTLLDPGDVVVCAKYNRAFRGAADAETTLDQFREAEVDLMFLDISIDTGTANGRMMAGILAVVSRHERELRIESTKEAMHNLARRGYSIGGTRGPYGWKIGSDNKLIPNYQERILCDSIVKMFQNGMSRPTVEKKLRVMKHEAGFDIGVSPYNSVKAAAHSVLDYPKMGNRRLTRLLGKSIYTIGFVLHGDHEAKAKLVHDTIERERIHD